jgi:hypothetical protein
MSQTIAAPRDEDRITVCAECLQASCWQGRFMCDKAKWADIKQMTVLELKKLGLENSQYWKTDEELAKAH